MTIDLETLIGAATFDRVAGQGDEEVQWPTSFFASGRSRYSTCKGIEMVYAIDFLDEAKTSIKRLSPDVSSRILKKIERMRNDLAGDVKRLDTSGDKRLIDALASSRKSMA